MVFSLGPQLGSARSKNALLFPMEASAGPRPVGAFPLLVNDLRGTNEEQRSMLVVGLAAAPAAPPSLEMCHLIGLDPDWVFNCI